MSEKKNCMRKVIIIVLIILSILVSILAIGLAAVVIMSPGKPDTITTKAGDSVSDSISEMEKINLGSIDQWIITRGYDKEKPVLLYLHGGPGSPEAFFIKKYNPDIEKKFVVVYWEQRGSGKSFSDTLTADDMTVEQFVSDIGNLSKYIMDKYGKEKIYLMGHSWGTLIGVLAAEKYPEYYYAYIGTGQEVDMARSEILVYDWLLDSARKEDNQKIIQDLNDMGLPPYPEDRIFDIAQKKMKWISRYNGDIYIPGKSMMMELFCGLFPYREYSLEDKLHYFAGSEFSLRCLWEQERNVDLISEVPALEIPVFILQGKHDYQTPCALAKEYYDMLRAPAKEFYEFELSAHSPMYEESEKFNEILEQILSETYK